ncbi:MAG: 3-isopropylmalate dehydratase large subunit [Acidiferrobacteraceae bacterium]|jgi:3-isopropylmalate/(R)-2-methylmalate dehydratase large subunit|nr:3-isopropylmalate dehydratase large subunit [Acidiferrobacteraceae bacterium]MDP6552581.1 3-isopropylmalate dehydratase large subunit [Arenicellales bacterium]MDP6791279.1 3-isopropylmalate dehydratase large subunit [Arenicellales bacterium]MDP6918342.1 3-isopropylmalate dehydratase large subunit [Arenicellales bacterium]HCY12341.1 3-isopropylmalate dehydratase large subunit [Gammaproteobacteria bacterium]|tara:strand:+ start:525 stop:1931 length:1407 start_codon:yes stop_codon:yes gene_type:complete
MTAGTLFDKIWDSHVVRHFENGRDMIHVDRHLLHDITSVEAFNSLKAAGRHPRNPELAIATADHMVATLPGRNESSFLPGREFVQALRQNSAGAGIRMFDLGDPHHGIIHVISHELAVVLPGLTVACGDSHTCTLGALGALPLGIGTSDVEHALATQTLVLQKPPAMRIRIEGILPEFTTGKDMVLHILGILGADGGNGHAVEFAGDAVLALPMEQRFTLCNMAVEFGARIGLIAPDETVFEYLKGRPFAPDGEVWRSALKTWRRLYSDPEAVFDKEMIIDAAAIEPIVTWGTSPEDVAPISGRVPDPAAYVSPEGQQAKQTALDYMGLTPGTPLEGLPIDTVFIGSCTNGRLGDLRAAASIARGKSIAEGVRAIVVAGSASIKRAAEAEGLDEIFKTAGFEWHEAGCSLCCAVGGDVVPEAKRCASTSNRNFEGRQGVGARTHLMSPAMAAAAAVAGVITDPRRLRE